MLRSQLVFKDNSTFKKLANKSEDVKNASGTLIKYTESHLLDQSVRKSLNAKIPFTKVDRIGQASIAKSRIRSLSHEARRCEYRHQQEVIQMQKKLDEASKQSQEKIKNLSREPATLQKENRRSRASFSKSMMEWTTYEQLEEIRALQNKQHRRVPLSRTEKSLDQVTLSLDCSEPLVKGLSHQIRELQETANVLQEAGGIFKDRELVNSKVSGLPSTSVLKSHPSLCSECNQPQCCQFLKPQCF